jgi:hypothetical protein
MRVAPQCILVLVAMTIAGCNASAGLPLGPEPKQLSPSSRIVTKDGQRFELQNGFVTRDSVIGLRARLRRAIPRDSVVSVDERRNASPAPIIMLGALAVGAAVLMMRGSPAMTRE